MLRHALQHTDKKLAKDMKISRIIIIVIGKRYHDREQVIIMPVSYTHLTLPTIYSV